MACGPASTDVDSLWGRPPIMSDKNQSLAVAVFVSGRGSNLKALLDAKASGRLDRTRFVLVFSDADSPPAFAHARAHGVPACHVSPKGFRSKKDYEKAVLDLLTEAGAEWIVLAGYMRIIGPTLLDAFPHRIINIHPSLLPAFPGLHAQRQALQSGVEVTGCTVHFVDSGTDTGPIILQRRVACRPDDTEETLAARILDHEHQALPDVLEWISQGRVRLEGRKVHIEGESSL